MNKLILKYKVFEGEQFRKLLKNNRANTLHYKKLNLNKTWLSDLIPNFTDSKNFSYSEKIRKFFRLITKIFFYDYDLIKKNNGKDKIWILISNSIRKSHRDLIKREEISIEKPSIITWKRKFKIKKISQIINQITYAYLSIKYLKKINKNSDYFDIAYKSLLSIDLYNSKIINKPKAILSFKDFQRHENAIIQKSKILKIQTFTTQHAVHPNFIRDNERGGNLVFLNCESKNILLWGNLLKQVYLRYHQDKTLYHSENFFIPKRKKITLKKKGILFCFGGKRHIYENLHMIKLLFKNKKYFKENYKIFIKLHPAITKLYFNKYFKNHLKEFNYQVIESKNKSNVYISNKNLFAITGLSGSYYDCLYLGLKTLFFDYAHKLSKPLPRVTFNLKIQSNLKQELQKLEKLSNIYWKNRTNVILKKVWGLNVNEKSKIKLTDQISKIINNKSSEII